MKRFKGSNPIQQKTVLRWAISYLPVLLIPLILGGLLYTYSMNAVQEKAETIQYTMLEDRADTLQEMFEKVSELTIQIQGNSGVNELASATSWSGEEKFLLMEVQELLSETIINNEEIDEISLYFPSKSQILCSNAAYSIHTERVLEARLGMDQDELFKMLSGDMYGTYHIQGENQLLYTSVYKKNEHFLKQKLIVIVTLSNDYMDYLLHTEEVDFFLVKGSGYYVAESSVTGRTGGDTGESGETATDVLIGEISLQKAMSLSFEGGPMQWIGNTCIYQDRVDPYELTLYSIQPDVGYVSALWNMRLLLAGYLVVCLLVGGYLVWYQSRRNYRPVDEMLTVIRRHGYLGGKGLAEAGQSLQHLIDIFEERGDAMSRQERLIVTHAIHQLFEPDHEKMGPGDEATYNMICHMLEGDVRQVVRFQSEGAEETGLEGDLLLFMLQNVLGEMLEGKTKFVFGELAGCYYLLAGERTGGGQGILREEMEEVSRFFTEQCGIDMAVEISGMQEGWDGIHKGYDEVRALAEYRSFLTGYPKVICYDERSGEELLQQIRQIFELERLMGLSLRDHNPGVLEREMAQYRKLLEAEAMQQWLGVDAGGQDQEEADRRITDQVQAYIDENYTDAQLTVGALAEMFEVSTPWLSRNFKKEKECGVLEYIGQLRMEKAKELLLTGLTVTETAERVGYYSSRPLIRLFTEKVGMTPMKYVKSQEEQSQAAEH